MNEDAPKDSVVPNSAAPVEQKPTEISISYKGPDLKTLAIGGGLLVGVAHAAQQALGTLAPSAPAAAAPVVASVAV